MFSSWLLKLFELGIHSIGEPVSFQTNIEDKKNNSLYYISIYWYTWLNIGFSYLTVASKCLTVQFLTIVISFYIIWLILLILFWVIFKNCLKL